MVAEYPQCTCSFQLLSGVRLAARESRDYAFDDFDVLRIKPTVPLVLALSLTRS